jgi:hypothetical protein
VLFAGTNDIAGARPASAQYVAERFDAFVARVRLAVPDALIFYVAITPSRARWSLWPFAMEANRLIEARVRAVNSRTLMYQRCAANVYQKNERPHCESLS